ncbi:MAG: DNA polymerase Y family protein [Pseudomonadota bacterium]|nr:DNA polymerase Y family protein [Pseudomonadota bacterium]
MLWLALIFPDLAVECLPGLADSPQSWVLATNGRVLACNAVAAAHGIQPGQGLSGALALDPALQQRPPDPQAQQQILQALAEWGLNFSAEVSLEGTHTLLLEVGTTRRCLGGLEALRQRLQAGLQQRGHRYLEGAAPTPLAALWLARGAPGSIVMHAQQLESSLQSLPVQSAGLSPACLSALLGAGIECIGQLFALPALALARRFGPELPDLLRRALARQADPRLCITAPQRFRRSCELGYPLHEIPRLMAVLSRMIADLADWAWRHAQLLTRIVLVLNHERQAASRIEIGFAGTRSASHLDLVIHESLQRQILPAAVVTLTLEILETQDAPAGSGDLLPAAPGRLREGQELLERLRARLGKAAVSGLAAQADHRPELAWAYTEPGKGGPASAAPLAGPRPLWLLETPRDLGVAALPRLGGPLALLAGPERIESGWWDGGDIARDYFVAAGPDGPQYWVYRERRGEGRWYLQGVFA